MFAYQSFLAGSNMLGHIVVLKNIFIACFAVVVMGGMGGAPPEEPDIRLYVKGVSEVLRPFGFIPILVPSSQQPGDVFNLNSPVRRSRASDCFPGLQNWTGEVFSISQTVSAPPAVLRGGLGLPSYAAMGLRLEWIKNLRIRYEDAYVVEASEHEMRRRLDGNCGEIAPVVQGKAQRYKRGEMPFVIGAVLWAKPVVTVDVAEGIDTALVLENFAITDGTAGIAVDARYAQALSIRSSIHLPIGAAPAFLPQPVPSGHLGTEQPDNMIALTWIPASDGNQRHENPIFNGLLDDYLSRY